MQVSSLITSYKTTWTKGQDTTISVDWQLHDNKNKKQKQLRILDKNYRGEGETEPHNSEKGI